MKYYSKIESIFNRGEDFKFNYKYRRPEYAYVKYWDATEKIDGTSTFLYFDLKNDYPLFGGRTPKTNTSGKWIPRKWFEQKINSVGDRWRDYLNMYDINSLQIFGESYGAGIQKGGGLYGDPSFRMFDVLVDDTYWLDQGKMTAVSDFFEIGQVPSLGHLTTEEALAMLGRQSEVTEQDRVAEGLVLKTPMFDSRGDRVMCKMKVRDITD